MVANTNGSAAMAWLRALEKTAPIARNRLRLLPSVIAEIGAQAGDAPALLSEQECLTYRGLAERANQYARWALEAGVAKGDVVCLLMINRPEYIAIWLGITSVGGVVSLLNTNLTGPSLAHCIDIVLPQHLIAGAEFAQALPPLASTPVIWVHGESSMPYSRIDQVVAAFPGENLSHGERRDVTLSDRALHIYTSGTTGLPKAANISHGRIMQWSFFFAGMMGAQPADRMYNCLPMYHSVGGVLAPGAILAAGGSLVIREKFSASQFWNDVRHWNCTIFQYIGELCRYLLLSPHSPEENRHNLRMACGNGLAAEVWEPFKERFQIPQILEFYGATEGGVSLFNVQGKRGAIGHIPGYLAHRFAPALVRFDVEKGEPVRDEQGFCIRCGINEAGEALGKMLGASAQDGSRFEGYTSSEASERKLIRNVFAPGDTWVRTGDLMRKDAQGYYYFVDRVGETFRWKGENVATSEVSEVICEFPGIRHANVYGVAVPAKEGRAGMAAVVVEDPLDLKGFRSHLQSRLPAYARPLFLRISTSVVLTGTFKYSKTDLMRQGYDPAATEDVLYFDNQELNAFAPLSHEIYERIQAGGIRL